ncbi:MAG: long-chain fatty acid--CoA ligase, partial [Chromatiales bacterium]
MAAGKIQPDEAQTLAGLFRERVRRTPDAIAYHHYDIGQKLWSRTGWADMATEVARWQVALERESLQAGDRVAIMLRNSREWVVFDQAALGLGLVTVPLYPDDRPDNVAHIIKDANVALLVVEGRKQWRRLQSVGGELASLRRIVSVTTIEEEDEPEDARLVSLNDWIFGLQGELQSRDSAPHELATIVYTSGTTGRPKGVMLSHANILSNAYASSLCAPFGQDDVFLSFLPLSHMFERTAGYYIPMMTGAQVAYARSVPQLAEDLQTIRPTVLVSVPRIYERVYAKIMDGLKDKSRLARFLFRLAVDTGWRRFLHRQHRSGWHPQLLLWPLLNRLVAGKVMSRLGGRMRIAVCGGAALSPAVARLFIGLGLPLYQGYGMTESSPVVSVNRPEDNVPESIGLPLEGIEVAIGPNDELLTRSDCVMLGYWNNKEATEATIDAEGWLHTGDKARIDDSGHIYITGRIKEIIVLANGEKVPPADMEMAIVMDPLFEQVLVLGEARPYLTALVVLSEEHWREFAAENDLDPQDASLLTDRKIERAVAARMAQQLRDFPGYAQVRRLALTLEPWTIENGLLTPTMKMKRARIVEQFAERIEAMYA